MPNKIIITSARSPTIKEEEELSHHGVKGMKWGIRKADYSEKVSRVRGYRQRRTMSEGDLKKAISRLQLEKQYKNLIKEDLAPGRTEAAKILKQVGTTALMAAAGTVGAKLAKEYLKNKMGK